MQTGEPWEKSYNWELENGGGENNIDNVQIADNLQESDSADNSAKLFERSRIKALAGGSLAHC